MATMKWTPEDCKDHIINLKDPLVPIAQKAIEGPPPNEVATRNALGLEKPGQVTPNGR